MAVESSMQGKGKRKRKRDEVDTVSLDVLQAAGILVEMSTLKYHLEMKNMQRNFNNTATDHDVIDIPVPDCHIYKGSHICGICGAHFATGQALGGHKRIHSNQKPPSDVAPVTGPATRPAVGPRVVICFNGKRLVD
jgi:C2H2-type zinc finger